MSEETVYICALKETANSGMRILGEKRIHGKEYRISYPHPGFELNFSKYMDIRKEGEAKPAVEKEFPAKQEEEIKEAKPEKKVARARKTPGRKKAK